MLSTTYLNILINISSLLINNEIYETLGNFLSLIFLEIVRRGRLKLMKIRLFNFPLTEQQKAIAILEQKGHEVTPLSIPDLFENISIEYVLTPILVYSDIPETDGQAIYQLLTYRYPYATIWMSSPSYRPEDVRAAFLSKYKNYILWSPDLEDFKQAVEQLNREDFDETRQAKYKYKGRMVSFPLEQQLVTDRILTSITDTSSNLSSNYYPLILRQSELRESNAFSICVIRLHLPLYAYIRPDYESLHNIFITQLKLHMETVENIASLPFEIRKIIKNNQLICLFHSKTEMKTEFVNNMQAYLRKVNARVQGYMGMSVLAGYSRPYSNMSETHIRYRRIITNLDQGYFYPSHTINMMDEDREYISFSKEIDSYIKKNLSIAIFNHDSDLIIKTLIEACNQFMEQKVMSTVAKTILLHTLVQFAQETDLFMLVNSEFIQRHLFIVIQHIVSYPLLQKLFELIGELCTQARKASGQNDANRLAIAMQYIQKYYCRKISLSSISNYLALSPNYFCGWFKKCTGENFGDMVIRYRIEAAKNMLSCTQKKICDIASEVGYVEIVSFNRVFKKNVGISPDQFRKTHNTP